MFTPEVADRLKYYVYRLIDPRNGETFYVGKGIGNRVFSHVKGELEVDDDIVTEKYQRIREIRVDGFELFRTKSTTLRLRLRVARRSKQSRADIDGQCQNRGVEEKRNYAMQGR